MLGASSVETYPEYPDSAVGVPGIHPSSSDSTVGVDAEGVNENRISLGGGRVAWTSCFIMYSIAHKQPLHYLSRTRVSPAYLNGQNVIKSYQYANVFVGSGSSGCIVITWCSILLTVLPVFA